EARAAGRKGGERVSQDREHMAEIGRQGGWRRAQRRREAKAAMRSPARDRGMIRASCLDDGHFLLIERVEEEDLSWIVPPLAEEKVCSHLTDERHGISH